MNAKTDETMWVVQTSTDDITLHIAQDPTYTLRFTGFKVLKLEVEEEPDPFEEYVREVRKAEGIVDPPREKKYRDLTSSQYAPGIKGQVLWAGNMVVSAPKHHKQLRWVADDSTGSDKPID